MNPKKRHGSFSTTLTAGRFGLLTGAAMGSIYVLITLLRIPLPWLPVPVQAFGVYYVIKACQKQEGALSWLKTFQTGLMTGLIGAVLSSIMLLASLIAYTAYTRQVPVMHPSAYFMINTLFHTLTGLLISVLWASLLSKKTKRP